MATQQSSPQTDLTTLVRNYVHYDNLTNNYNKQLGGARKLRNDFENKIIQNLRSNRMENAIIQVSGANLQIAEEKVVPSFSLPRIEAWLHKYYKQKGNGIDETDSILRFMKLQKTNETTNVACLKKTSMPTPIPPPPSNTPSLK
jgi:hypothetical protein